MSYECHGVIYHIDNVREIATKSGQTFSKRSLTLEVESKNEKTGETYAPDYVTFEFGGKFCDTLSGFSVGTPVTVKFDLSGRKYVKDGEERFFTTLRAFAIDAVIPQPTPQEVLIPTPPAAPEKKAVEPNDLPF